jgi:hypothetical protein
MVDNIYIKATKDIYIMKAYDGWWDIFLPVAPSVQMLNTGRHARYMSAENVRIALQYTKEALGNYEDLADAEVVIVADGLPDFVLPSLNDDISVVEALLRFS